MKNKEDITELFEGGDSQLKLELSGDITLDDDDGTNNVQ